MYLILTLILIYTIYFIYTNFIDPVVILSKSGGIAGIYKEKKVKLSNIDKDLWQRFMDEPRNLNLNEDVVMDGFTYYVTYKGKTITGYTGFSERAIMELVEKYV